MFTKLPGLKTIAILICSFMLTACQAAVASPPPTHTETLAPKETTAPTATAGTTTEVQAQDVIVLATPYADSPAAGICMDAPGEETISVEIFPDIPSPRCLQVTGDQKLNVINRTDSILLLSLGDEQGSLPPEQEYLFDKPFGEYLAPGVHVLDASPYSGPEIWLQAE